jgi:hypothetical protein
MNPFFPSLLSLTYQSELLHTCNRADFVSLAPEFIRGGEAPKSIRGAGDVSHF